MNGAIALLAERERAPSPCWLLCMSIILLSLCWKGVKDMRVQAMGAEKKALNVIHVACLHGLHVILRSLQGDHGGPTAHHGLGLTERLKPPSNLLQFVSQNPYHIQARPFHSNVADV